MGGLANVMFQVAGIESIAKDNRFQTTYGKVSVHFDYLNAENKHNNQLTHAHDYLRMFKNFNWKTDVVPRNMTNRISVPFRYAKINHVDNTCYDGFFQSEKYFKHNEEHIRHLFQPSDEIQRVLNAHNTDQTVCSIHVRRGDYTKFPGYHPPITLDYIMQAVEEIGKVDKYIIFSDDMVWCENNIKLNNCRYVSGFKDYIDLFLQTKATHNIISNSSFSWWGAWLNSNPNKKVVAPAKWFGPNNKNRHNDVDIVPDSWIKI
jgi:hypothetical protein